MNRNVYLIFAIFAGLATAHFDYKPCALRKYPKGYVCVCNETYCDTIPDLKLNSRDHIIFVSTSEGGLRFKVFEDTFKPAPNNTQYASFVIKDLYPNEFTKSRNKSISDTFEMKRMNVFQNLTGFGASITGTVKHILTGLTHAMRQDIFRAFYSNTDGIGMNMMRLPIGGSDFDLRPWSYAEYPPNDPKLSNFTTLYPADFKTIKYVKEIEEVCECKLKMVGTAWSPPPWMKNNNEWSGQNWLLPQYYQTWADYHLKWLKLMKEQNMSFWAITTGNEPTNALVAWRLIHILDLGWNAVNQGKWVGENLGPTIRNSEFKDIKIIGVDDESYVLPWWLDRMNIGCKGATDYIDGVGTHWYLDTIVPATYLVDQHNVYPDKFLMTTESCISGKPILGLWSRTERYMVEYHKEFVHWSQGWIHWNMILNVEGGPSYQNHSNDAIIVVNTTSNNEFYKQPDFYAIGHYAKFLPPGSQRVHVLYHNFELIAIVFDRPDGSTVMIVLNIARKVAKIKYIDEQRRLDIEIPPKSIHTMWYYKSST